MPTLEEMTAWTAEDIRAEILVALPKGLHFGKKADQESGFWVVEFWRVDPETGTKAVLWTETGADERIMLFNAYGWLWMQKRPKVPDHSPWKARQQELTPGALRERARQQAVRGEVASENRKVRDPEDLDPKEVQTVYERARKG